MKSPWDDVLLPKRENGYRLKLLLWLRSFTKKFQEEHKQDAVIFRIKIEMPFNSLLKNIEENTQIVMDSLELLKCSVKPIEYAWNRIPNSGCYQVAVIYRKCCGWEDQIPQILEKYLLHSTYGAESREEMDGGNELSTLLERYDTNSSEVRIGELVGFLLEFLAYAKPQKNISHVVPYKNVEVSKYLYDVDMVKLCGISKKRTKCMRQEYAELKIFDY